MTSVMGDKINSDTKVLNISLTQTQQVLFFKKQQKCHSSAYPNSEVQEGQMKLDKVFGADQLSQSDAVLSASSSFHTDDALANWNKWLKIHEQQQNMLSARLNRPPQCLLMNSNFTNLYVNQEKDIIVDSSNNFFCDEYRGHPNFWKTDNSFKNNGMSLGVYEPINRRYDRSRLDNGVNQCPMPVERQYIGVPEAIIREKKLDGKPCLQTRQEKWDQSNYVIEKKEILRDQLKIICEHKPETSNLVIVGKPFISQHNRFSGISEEKQSLDPSGKSTPTFDTNSLLQDSERQFLVTIRGEEIKETSEMWTVNFENCETNEWYNICLTIKNLKASCLRYSWLLDLPLWTVSEWPLKYTKSQSRCFYFAKCSGVVLPGCQCEKIFSFQSFKAGVFSESWKLKLSQEPDKWDDKTVKFLAVAVEGSESRTNIEAIESYVNQCTSYTLARKAVEELLERNRRERQELPYNWLFFEEQIFLYNSPNLFYDNKCVQILKVLHSKINKGPWDYSVNNLRKELLTKSLTLNLDKEIELYAATVCQLLKPNTPISLMNEKKKSAYELLRCFLIKMELDSVNLKYIMKIPTTLTTSTSVDTQSSYGNKRSSNASNKYNRLSSKTPLHKSGSVISKPSRNKSVSDNSNTISYCSDYKISESDMKIRKQEYLEALYIKTYQNLSTTVDQLSAIFCSYDKQRKRTVFDAIKDHNVY